MFYTTLYSLLRQTLYFAWVHSRNIGAESTGYSLGTRRRVFVLFSKLLVKFRQVFHVSKCSCQLKNWAGIYKNISRTWRPGKFDRKSPCNYNILVFLVTMKTEGLFDRGINYQMGAGSYYFQPWL